MLQQTPRLGRVEHEPDLRNERPAQPNELCHKHGWVRLAVLLEDGRVTISTVNLEVLASRWFWWIFVKAAQASVPRVER
jgi:hypothetical protein